MTPVTPVTEEVAACRGCIVPVTLDAASGFTTLVSTDVQRAESWGWQTRRESHSAFARWRANTRINKSAFATSSV
jgi:hypothetical protein